MDRTGRLQRHGTPAGQSRCDAPHVQAIRSRFPLLLSEMAIRIFLNGSTRPTGVEQEPTDLEKRPWSSNAEAPYFQATERQKNGGLELSMILRVVVHDSLKETSCSVHWRRKGPRKRTRRIQLLLESATLAMQFWQIDKGMRDDLAFPESFTCGRACWDHMTDRLGKSPSAVTRRDGLGALRICFPQP